jgi:hypothetical protein
MNKDYIILKKDSIPILAFENIARDAVEKVNLLTGESYTGIPGAPDHKAMYESNVNIGLTGWLTCAHHQILQGWLIL